MSNEHEPEVPPTGAVFTFGKSKFAENAPSKFWIKRDLIVAISCGDEHTAVVTQTGRLFTFGSNEFGQLGLGHHDNVLKPSCVKVLKPDKVLAVACGKSHTVVAMMSGRVWAFGSNVEGQLGIGHEDQESVNKPYEVQIDMEDPVISLAAGSSHTLALTKSGTVFVWGSNKEGQLGLGAEGEETLYVPTPLTTFHAASGPAKAIGCGYYHSAIVTDEGEAVGGALYTFGEADGGKLGLGDGMTEADLPTRVELEENVIDVSCGGNHTLALTSMGEVYSFGTSSNGQLGLGTRILETPQPLKIASIAGSHRIERISCGENHTALVTAEGKLLTFGDGRHGKLCLDVETLTNHYTPVPSTRFRGFHVENAVCGGCHTMVQARPIPGYQPDEEVEVEGVVNGHEEINLEARRRHRQEKLPPLSPTEAAEDPDPEDDAEKILTIEQAENGEDEANDLEEPSKPLPTRGQKISNFFRNLGKKKEQEIEEEGSSPKKKQVRFFGKNKKEEKVTAEAAEEDESGKEDEDGQSNAENNQEEEEKDKEGDSDEDEEDENEDDDVSSIEEASEGKEENEAAEAPKKKGKHVTIREDVQEEGGEEAEGQEKQPKKKSRACTIL